MDDLSAWLQEWLSVMQEAWPAMPPMSQSNPRQVWSGLQAIKQSFVDGVVDGTLALPCWVIDYGDFNRSDIGVSATIYEMSVSVYYIAADGTKQRDIHAALEDFRRRIDDPSRVFETFQGSGNWGRVNTSQSSQVNQRIAAELGVKVTSGSVEWTPGIQMFEPMYA